MWTEPAFTEIAGSDAIPEAALRGRGPWVLFTVGTAVLGLVIAHVWSYLVPPLFRQANPCALAINTAKRMMGRVTVMHATIILGTLAAAMTGTRAGLVAVFVVLKTGLDYHLQVAGLQKDTHVQPPTCRCE